MILSSSLGVRLRLGLGVRLRLRLRPRPSPRGKVGLSENLRDGKSDGVDGVVAGVGGVDDPLNGRSTDGMPRGAAASRPAAGSASSSAGGQTASSPGFEPHGLRQTGQFWLWTSQVAAQLACIGCEQPSQRCGGRVGVRSVAGREETPLPPRALTAPRNSL